MRKAQDHGFVHFGGRRLRIPKAFRGRRVALRPTTTDGVFDIYYRHQKIAVLDFSSRNGDLQCVHHVPEQTSTISPV